MIYSVMSTVEGACGVGVASEFSDGDSPRRWGDTYVPITLGTPGGCGWICAGFIYGDITCDKAFKEMSQAYKLVYVTEPRININSDNLFYFAIFDVAGSGKPIGFSEYNEAEDSFTGN